MPVRKPSEQPQPTISSFFLPSQKTAASKRAASPPYLDLTGELSDGEPPTKKAKWPSTSYGTPEPPVGGMAEWRFTPVSPDKPETSAAPKQRTEAEIAAAKQRREAFKKKLLLENNPFLRNRPVPEPEPMPIEVVDVDSAGEESDQAFKELSEMFSNKAKGKGKAVSAPPRKAKKPPELGPSGEAYTPLENQIRQLKAENPGTLLMVEVGYKYKFFGDDAKVAAKELGMVAFNDRNFLVASIPTHRRDVHLKNLLSKGYRVGIVNQIETAALKKVSDNRSAPFTRKLTHLYTAATYVDSLDSVDDLERYTPPPFLCLVEEETKGVAGDVSVGMITICPSTGDVVWDDFSDTPMRLELETRLVHTRPAELLLPNSGLSDATTKMLQHFTGTSSSDQKTRTEHFGKTMSYVDAFQSVSDFYTDKTKAAVASESFKSGRLMAEVAAFPKRVVIALAHAIRYLSAFSIADAFLETKFFSKFTTRAHMLLAANTLTNLEIYRNETDQTTTGSLLWVLDRTKTKFGARLLRSWIGRPLVDKRVLQERVEAVEEIIASPSEKLATLRGILKKLPDLAKGLCRIQYGQCTPQELAILLPAFHRIAVAFGAVGTPSDVGLKSSLLNEIIFSLPKLKEPISELLAAVSLKHAAEGRKDIMWTDPERYPKIADADMAIQHIEVELEDQLKAIRKLLRIPSLKWSSVAGDDYLVEVKRSENRPIPDHWILHSKTKHFARYLPPTVKQKLDERAQYQERLQAEANTAFSSFLEEISLNHYGVLRDAVNKLAVADCLLSLALVALQDNYVRPTYTDDDTLEIVDGRHPMVESLRPDPFVPNTIMMGGSRPRNKIITGPNMGGKSSCVRMIALIAIMAQIGSYVPAKSVKLGLLDSVLTRMGASDDLARGRSTFMVEMSETSEILQSATQNSLVILDELGRGTSTFDGMAIADAVMQQLVETTKCKTLFITHYPLVASNLESKYPSDVENLHMGYEAETRIDGTRDITFLYRLTPGMATESFGIECGRLAGLPESLLTIAAESAVNLQVQVTDRTRRNRLFKAARLIAESLSRGSLAAASTIQELRAVVKAL
ncbi:putative DNA-binding domain of DNA mismatch repair MUTS family protein [Lyophyllum shimeji]|uniref:DNA mismatch repair protein MSH3 n=1 Tax=Lyophyllum shimeji TaxID=47721 RepID=A0A9P3PH59_LYOSH|nr:putative DNA-binding domain of DNA mismatch repair MUTS family protein [Lyophyllum shimeji]